MKAFSTQMANFFNLSKREAFILKMDFRSK